jgi:flavorubredoxin
MNAVLEETKFRIVGPGISVRYVPTHQDLRKCVDLGREIGKAVRETE